jgi:hypothetical protein
MIHSLFHDGMGGTSCSSEMKIAITRLYGIAEDLLKGFLHGRTTVSSHIQQAQVLAHISGVLAVACEAPSDLETAMLEELADLCRVCFRPHEATDSFELNVALFSGRSVVAPFQSTMSF